MDRAQSRAQDTGEQHKKCSFLNSLYLLLISRSAHFRNGITSTAKLKSMASFLEYLPFSNLCESPRQGQEA